MRFWLRSFVLLSLASGLLACGDDSDTNGPGGSGDCTCSVTIQDDARDLACGESACVGPIDDDRWVTCGEGGPVIGNRLCILDRWEATTPKEHDCDGRQTCAPDTYCVVRAGEPPRQTECRPLPAGCTPTTNGSDFCDCLEPDAMMAGVCAGASYVNNCDYTDPRAMEVFCND
ncbi:hypothetical protein KEG38_36870 [Polyangium jinanense]|uniref:hypothetical protein n=1 Tax=Polyangium jinanense TaxID=2829994 RepID=UPI00233FAAB3|nr:hypothetical protein [Polyangium jinanense]MDC3959485.1 hypothetical protein [Polyangium jinanense]